MGVKCGQPDDEHGERVADYELRLWRRDHLLIQSIVVFPRPADKVPESPFVIPWRQQAS